MKRTAITILLALCASGLFAQTAYDALMLSENSYEGTARSVAMGNAFTALGGDLGAVTINPAGSAMAPYSQITITPGITVASTTAEGVSPYDNGHLPYFQRKLKSDLTKFNLPNIGFSIIRQSNCFRTEFFKNNNCIQKPIRHCPTHIRKQHIIIQQEHWLI